MSSKMFYVGFGKFESHSTKYFCLILIAATSGCSESTRQEQVRFLFAQKTSLETKDDTKIIVGCGKSLPSLDPSFFLNGNLVSLFFILNW